MQTSIVRCRLYTATTVAVVIVVAYPLRSTTSPHYRPSKPSPSLSLLSLQLFLNVRRVYVKRIKVELYS
jgi:hypothetical protein